MSKEITPEDAALQTLKSLYDFYVEIDKRNIAKIIQGLWEVLYRIRFLQEVK